MSSVRICFLGTPEFAAVHLNSLLQNSNYKIVGVVSQPDRPAGRKMQLTASAVKQLALSHHLKIITPENLRKESAQLNIIKTWNADVAVVVAYGQILSQEFLDSFKFGAVNVHGSLLPRWRGAAPIQRCIEAGDKFGGVSLQKIVKKLDAGAVIGERKTELNSEITASELYPKLALLGCELLQNELLSFLKGKIEARDQDESLVTLAPKIEKEESLLNWSQPAKALHDKVRAFTMGPGTYVLFQNKRLKIHKTKVVRCDEALIPSRVNLINSQELIIETSNGCLSLLEVQPESKSKLAIQDFLKSVNIKKGDLFV